MVTLCYLGDMIEVEGEAEEAVRARRWAQAKFSELAPC